MQTVSAAAGGQPGLERLARAWHERVMADVVVRHAFERGYRPDHVERLAAYWNEALGGPAIYTTRYGDESFVVREHSGNGPHDEMNARAIACFDAALAEIGIAVGTRLHSVLHDYFAWATPFVNRFERSVDDVPAGLSIPRWSWDGPGGL